ncbi:Gfo/Idh/MocA family protein [Paenibacillus montanisoli]|uniref:Gfo/Idh/MocA family oxidoreductase n=1 Tax=Paenibacillus montanisoli TaxID=2081970 RepID=A0A328UDW5_9BACL|nr:Gfo/Idh/MocA family oxidoreductase [Paenibacillus montanisoli]RAP78544.1 gfo/Idh/MocA family oxidoreductase [Paenibacillus montanisoli]
MGKVQSEKVRVAVVGAGGMANAVHYPSLHSLPDVEIAGICDINPDRLHATAEKYLIPRKYDDYQKMIKEVEPDAVYVIGQPHILYDVWDWCLENGQNLYIEKPMGLNMHQARALAYKAEKHDCITQVSFQRRSSPMVSQLRDECLKRGPIVHAVCKFYKSEIKPFLGARDHMLDDSVHSIDTLRWMCGGEVVRIESETKRIQVPNINFISATLHFDNGSTGYLINSWSSGRRIFSVEMHAPNICVEAEHETKGYLYADGDTKGIEYDAREIAGGNELYIYGGFQAKHREFIDSLKSGTLPSSHFGDAVHTMEVAEKILAQAMLSGRG